MPSVSDEPITYPRLATRVRALSPSCGPVRVVAIDGPSGAGKSTFARHLAAALDDAPLIGSDNFRVPWDADPLIWWRPFNDAVLTALRAGRPGRLRRWNWKRDAYGPEEEIPPAPVLIVEGVGAGWRECPAAYRIWVDAPSFLRRTRVLERDGAQYAADWDAWSAREHRHFTADHTQARADLEVDGARLGSVWFP